MIRGNFQSSFRDCRSKSYYPMRDCFLNHGDMNMPRETYTVNLECCRARKASQWYNRHTKVTQPAVLGETRRKAETGRGE